VRDRAKVRLLHREGARSARDEPQTAKHEHVGVQGWSLQLRETNNTEYSTSTLDS
jgi:hypothetical protein